ncbi:MAG: hypothetical protein FWC91_10035 [Defluviitaleaceae bacterium]|nr:hypothetical protein [Defluviitaleaceae bacterium]
MLITIVLGNKLHFLPHTFYLKNNLTTQKEVYIMQALLTHTIQLFYELLEQGKIGGADEGLLKMSAKIAYA